jgi:hypothetical protein
MQILPNFEIIEELIIQDCDDCDKDGCKEVISKYIEILGEKNISKDLIDHLLSGYEEKD